jgi:sugar transferase (PEP-CTERM/EpsH1 system associated)
VSLTAFHDAALQAYVREVLEECAISTIYVFSGQMGQYVPDSFKGRVVMDFVDVDSAKFESYASQGKGFMRWVHAREARLLRDEEARLAARADVSLLITVPEAELFASRLTAVERAQADIQVLKNGIDSEFFDPTLVEPEPRIAELPQPRLIFTGQMDYAPNVDAMIRAADRIMPLIRAEIPEATLHVVGRNPVTELTERHGLNGVHVWGRVDDMRPWLRGSDLALVPLEIARGVQNKVLEAMSMALPVVLTSAAATGIPGIDGHHFTIAESDEELAAAVIAWFTDPRKVRIKGLAARRFVSEKANWHAALAVLPELVGVSRPAVRDAA